MVLVATLTFLTGSLPDRWGPPKPAIYVSDDRRTALEVVPRYSDRMLQVRGTVFVLADDGTRKTLWSKSLRNMPLFALVTNSGRVATFDEYGAAGAEHALVLYGVDGGLVKDWSLKQFLKGEEYDRVPASVSSRWWWRFAPPGDVPHIESANEGGPLRVVVPTTIDVQSLTIEVDLVAGKRLK